MPKMFQAGNTVIITDYFDEQIVIYLDYESAYVHRVPYKGKIIFEVVFDYVNNLDVEDDLAVCYLGTEEELKELSRFISKINF